MYPPIVDRIFISKEIQRDDNNELLLPISLVGGRGGDNVEFQHSQTCEVLMVMRSVLGREYDHLINALGKRTSICYHLFKGPSIEGEHR